MKSNLFIRNSWEDHMNFIWSSNELLMNFIWNKIKFDHISLHVVRGNFIWTPYRRTNKVYMLYPCNTSDMRFINSSHEIHMELIWILNDFNFMWTSCELHKNYMTSTQEAPMYYTWIWSLVSLLCTSYEWASKSIVQSLPIVRAQPTTLWAISSRVIWCTQQYALCTECDPIVGCIHSSSDNGDVIRWKHFFALLALCVGNLPVTGEFPSQRPVSRSFDVFFELTVE